jgi:adenine deaminase
MSDRELVLRHVIADVHARRTMPAEVRISGGRIASIRELAGSEALQVDPGILIPGLVDAHVHIESSMLPPWEFARVAVRHGTVATVSDPHEIANVLGADGIRFMLDDAAGSPFTFWFGVPSCVPATTLETAGASLDAGAVSMLLDDPRLPYLSEVMNWPGVLARDPEVMAKIAAAKARGKRVDGHAPGLLGADIVHYAAAGIETDHECRTAEEGRARVAAGMMLAIREGSAARNMDALLPVLREHPDRCMWCTDDAHPDTLLAGHIDRLMARAVAAGIDPFDALRAGTLNTVTHYRMPCGLLRVGDRADMALVDDLRSFRVRRTWTAGAVVAEEGVSRLPRRASATPNRFRPCRVNAADLALRAAPGAGSPVCAHVITVEDGQLVTGHAMEAVTASGSAAAGDVAGGGATEHATDTDRVVEPDPSRDLLLLAVVNRYTDAPPALALVRGIGLTRGAIASSVAHDSHNVVAVGASRADLAEAINAVCAARGGLALSASGTHVLELPIAGLMSDRPAEDVAATYARLTDGARALGSPLHAPFMTLAFLALIVIPALKLSDRGLVDATAMRFLPPLE